MLNVLVAIAIVALVVMIHYEALHQISKHLKIVPVRPRMHVAAALIGALLAHVVEIYLFAVGHYWLGGGEPGGGLNGVADPNFNVYSYYSFVTYTTLGFGDLTPKSALQPLTAMEALTGLVLIAWTASFLYLQMQRQWEQQ